MCTCGKVVLAVGIIGVAAVVVGIVIGFTGALDGFINDQIVQSVRLEQRTEQYERWAKFPFPLQFKVYVFNVTNPAAILEGYKPVVEEIGPFVYDEYRQKEDIVYEEKADSYTYTQRLTFHFNEELSTYPEDTEVTVLNVALQGIFLTVEGTNNILLTNSAWNNLFGGDGLFLTIAAKKLFFEGYDFCINDDQNIIGKQFCKTIKTLLEESKTMTYDDKKIQFSFFAQKNDSNDGVYQISGGNHDVNTLGAIFSWEGEQYLDVWNNETSTCNRIRGRDSSIYPPFNNESSAFDVFDTNVCRIVNLKTTKTTQYEDVEGIYMPMDIDQMKNEDEADCYCTKQTRDLNGEFECLPVGFADLNSCLKGPVLASYPHMLWANETYANTVDGLNADSKKHESFVVIEPNTGTPLQGRKRIQFNMIIRPIENLQITQNLPKTVFPLIWVEEALNLPDDQLEKLDNEYFGKLRMLNTVSYALVGIGAIATIGCLLYFALKFLCR